MAALWNKVSQSTLKISSSEVFKLRNFGPLFSELVRDKDSIPFSSSIFPLKIKTGVVDAATEFYRMI